MQYAGLATNAGPPGGGAFSLAPETGDSPIPVTGTIDAEGNVAGGGDGQYAGFPTNAVVTGEITYWDYEVAAASPVTMVPRRLQLKYTVGQDGRLPGGKSIVFALDCFFDPPQDVFDPDSDGVPRALHATLSFASAAAGILSPEPTAFRYRDGSGIVQEVPYNALQSALPQSPLAWLSEDDKRGPFEASIEREYYKHKGKFGGSLDYTLSEHRLYYGPPIAREVNSSGSPDAVSPLSGNISGFFEMDPDGSAVSDFAFGFHAHGMPFDFLNTDSGDWSWRSDPNRGVMVNSLNTNTGQASLTVPVLLDAENLRAVYPGTAAPAGDGDIGGEPIRWLENVNINFAPLALVVGVMDNCPDTPNASQDDTDTDGVGDACEGYFWADANCNMRISPRDALATIRNQVGLPFDEPAACSSFGTQIGDVTVGDWNCDGQQTAQDILVPLLERAGLPQQNAPDCPEPGEFVTNVG
jgi:hypothetical protein